MNRIGSFAFLLSACTARPPATNSTGIRPYASVSAKHSVSVRAHQRKSKQKTQDDAVATALTSSTAALPEDGEGVFCDEHIIMEESNCTIGFSWHNASDGHHRRAVVTNTTIAVKLGGVRLRVRRPGPVALLLLYSAVNVVATSIIPIPIATILVPVATLCFGLLGGIALNVLTTCLGAYVGLLLTRHGCRPHFLRMLGAHKERWLALDAALAEHGYAIPLLIRCSPVSPVVLTNTLLSLTSVRPFTYLWTTLVGEIVTSTPIAYAAHVGTHLGDARRAPLTLAGSLVGLIASVVFAWKVGVVARETLRERAAPMTDDCMASG